MADNDGYRFTLPDGDADPEMRKLVTEAYGRIQGALDGTRWDIGMSALNSVIVHVLLQSKNPEHQLALTIEALCTGIRTLLVLREEQAQAAPAALPDKDLS
jgi:hypothetical protein